MMTVKIAAEYLARALLILGNRLVEWALGLSLAALLLAAARAARAAAARAAARVESRQAQEEKLVQLFEEALRGA
jgi:hypothetical protein